MTKLKVGSTAESDRAAVEGWLKASKAFKNVEVGQMVDAWYE